MVSAVLRLYLELWRLFVVRTGHLLGILAGQLGGQRDLRQNIATLGHKTAMIGLVVYDYLLAVRIEVGVGAIYLEVFILFARIMHLCGLLAVCAILTLIEEMIGAILVLLLPRVDNGNGRHCGVYINGS